jgi:putative PIN family toxin of toxin-antitoxin system
MPNDKNKEPKRRAVLDTNVYISIFHHKGKRLYRLWELAVEGRYTLLVSRFIIREFARVSREDFQGDEAEILDTLKLMVKVGELFDPKSIPTAVPNDPDDNHIIAGAVEGRADLIVFGDRHLLALGQYAGIPIVRPVDFLQTVGEPTPLFTKTPPGRR